MDSALGRWLGIVLATVYAAMMIAEVAVRVIDEAGTGPILFWGLSLSSAAVLVLVGTLVVLPGPGSPLVITAGVAIGTAPTLWTIVVPVFGIVVITVAFRDLARREEQGSEPTS